MSSGDPGVLHPVGLRLLAVVDEQHAVAGGQFIAKHQPASAFGIVVGDLDVVTLAAQFDPSYSPLAQPPAARPEKQRTPL